MMNGCIGRGFEEVEVCMHAWTWIWEFLFGSLCLLRRTGDLEECEGTKA